MVGGKTMYLSVHAQHAVYCISGVRLGNYMVENFCLWSHEDLHPCGIL